jgi:hypothetical protein
MVRVIGEARRAGQLRPASRMRLLGDARVDCPVRGSIPLSDCLGCEFLRAIAVRRRPRVVCEAPTLRVLQAY